MATIKKAGPKRPPRTVWCAINTAGVAVGVYATKMAAQAAIGVAIAPLDVVGPYVLAERRGQR